LIEGGSQRYGSIGSDIGEIFGNIALKFDLKDPCGAIRIDLSEMGVCHSLCPSADLLLQITGVMLAAQQPPFRTIEWVSHGKEWFQARG
jgi:hypothetical protein